MRNLDIEAVEAITEFVFPPDAPLGADFTIVLGISLWQRPLDAAVRLFRAGKAGKLVFTGGYNIRIGGAEADLMAEAALARGVPPADVICENRATNTRENFEFSWELITAQAEPAHAVNFVGIHHHIPRALRTAKAVLPACVRVGHVSYPSIHFGPDNWHACERGRHEVLKELGKLAVYHPGALPPGLPVPAS